MWRIFELFWRDQPAEALRDSVVSHGAQCHRRTVMMAPRRCAGLETLPWSTPTVAVPGFVPPVAWACRTRTESAAASPSALSRLLRADVTARSARLPCLLGWQTSTDGDHRWCSFERPGKTVAQARSGSSEGSSLGRALRRGSAARTMSPSRVTPRTAPRMPAYPLRFARTAPRPADRRAIASR